MKSTTESKIIEDLKGIYRFPEVGLLGSNDPDFYIKASKLAWQARTLESILEVDPSGVDITSQCDEDEDEGTAVVTATCTVETLLLNHFGSFVPDDEEEELTEEQVAVYESEWEDAVKEIIGDETGWNVASVEHFRYNSFAGTNTYRLTLNPPVSFVIAEGRFRWIDGAGMVLDT